MVLPTAALNWIPSYGIGESVWLVFMGAVSYVAYRDIFERRSGNVPMTKKTTPLPVPARLARQGVSDAHSRNLRNLPWP